MPVVPAMAGRSTTRLGSREEARAKEVDVVGQEERQSCR